MRLRSIYLLVSGLTMLGLLGGCTPESPRPDTNLPQPASVSPSPDPTVAPKTLHALGKETKLYGAESWLSNQEIAIYGEILEVASGKHRKLPHADPPNIDDDPEQASPVSDTKVLPSPDGAWLLYEKELTQKESTRYRFTLAAVSGGAPLTIDIPEKEPAAGIVWLPDSATWIRYGRVGEKIFARRYHIAAGKIVADKEEQVRAIPSLVLSDGRFLYKSDDQRTLTLCAGQPDKNCQTIDLAKQLPGIESVAVSRDATLVVAVCRKDESTVELWTLPQAGGTPRCLIRDTELPTLHDADLSPDAKSLIVAGLGSPHVPKPEYIVAL